ncbi:MAG TPA: hypothetical protein VNW90_30270 [Acetobacteraceae bacterium]|nr:hypothetical protein [Acetobacteraceae bacterium]
MATIAALSLVAMLYLTLCMDRTVGVFDEALILLGAARVLDGAVPHRDFYTLYGPGQFYVLAALYKIFGVSVLVERAWDTVVRCCSVVLVFIIVSQAASRGLAILAAAASLVCLGSFGSFGYPVFPALAAALMGLAFLAPNLGQVWTTSGLVAAGVCAGVIMLFRYDVGFATFGAECALLAFCIWFQSWNRARCLRTILHCLILFGLGFAVVVVPVATAFALCGALPDLVFDVVTFPAEFYVKMRSLPFPRLSSLRADPAAFAVYLPLVLCVAAMPTIVATARYRWGSESVGECGGQRRPAREASPWTLLGLVILTLVFFGKGVVRVSTIHMAMALITSLALACVLAQPVPGRGLAGRTMVVVALLAGSVFTLSCLRTGLQNALQNIAWARDPASWELPTSGLPPASGSCRMPAGLERLACFRTSAATIETILYVQHRTAADDPVFIGLPWHDRIVVSDVLLYFGMNRPPATKWYEFDPGLQTSAPIQQEMVGELQRAKPKLIVIDASWSEVREPNDSVLSSGVTVLDDYLRNAFEPVATFGSNTIMRARS